MSPEFAWPPLVMGRVRKGFLHSTKISPDIFWVLEALSRGNDLTFPCSVTLKNGAEHPCVLFVENEVYLKHFSGCYGDVKEPCVDLIDVDRVKASPHKTLISVEKKMYEHGETNIGGYVVVLILSDGTRYWHDSGDFLEFATVPEGYKS